jgi:RsiW-degrading membrane proteinase PrsW (M82 family)
MLWNEMYAFLQSFFIYPGLSWNLILVAFGLAVVFAAVWLLAHWPPIFKNPWFWPVLVFGGMFTVLTVTFIQIPIQYYLSEGFLRIWDGATLTDWILLTSIPSLLVSGLVQEGAKMVPIAFWWWRSGKNISLKMGLAIGAIAGAGMGLFEAFWIHSQMFNAGWTTQYFQGGFLGIVGFWERFFTLGFHIAVSALAGYGLAKGKAWQYFLIAAGLHGVFNWGVALLQKGALSLTQVEVYLAVFTVILTAVVMILRWGRNREELPVGPVEPVPLESPTEPAAAVDPGV